MIVNTKDGVKEFQRKTGASDLVANIIKYAILILGAACAIVPALVVVLASLKTKEAYIGTDVLEIPGLSGLTFDNYYTA